MNSCARRCACGNQFFVDDRSLCIECTLQRRAHARLVQGPTKPNAGKSRFGFLACELAAYSPVVRQPEYGQRLCDGFRMLKGGELRR